MSTAHNVTVTLVDGYKLQPGDTLLLRVDPELDNELLIGCRDRLVEMLPDNQVIVIACRQIGVVPRAVAL